MTRPATTTVNSPRYPLLRWVAAMAVLAAPVVTLTAGTETFVDRVLRQEGLSGGDLRARDAGRGVVKSLDTAVRKELAHFGVVHINTSTARFVERFHDIVRFERGPGIPQIGRFSAAPRLEDLASLTLPAKDVAALKACRPGDCDLKLSAAGMARFRDGVNWSSPSASQQQVDEIVREMILDLVKGYQAKGNAALGQFEDGAEALSLADEFRALLRNDHPLPLAVPRLIAYLEEYPRNRPAGASDFFYWSVVDFGLKPTVRVNHVIVYPLEDDPSGVTHVIAIKQLYATHYFHSTLELRFLAADPPDTGRQGFHLLSLTRSRIDGTNGLSGALLRAVINRRSRNAVRGYLEHMKRQVETPDTRSPGGAGQPCSPTGGPEVCVDAR